jgi:hypothetical protein
MKCGSVKLATSVFQNEKDSGVNVTILSISLECLILSTPHQNLSILQGIYKE